MNHTIVHARDNRASAEFLANILDLEIGTEWGPFIPVDTANGVTLDFATVDEKSIAPQHYAFLVPEDDFDGIFGRIKGAGVDFFGDPLGGLPGRINYNHGGRGVYFLDPSGHYLEVITQPYDNVVTDTAG
ncbi:VOC family protein [Streptomyces sp. NP-1717]|uniref:VOC family protein n=1 Tax=Streptomyces sp. NP-1717 TaxID=2704470 RepID=UPI001F5C0DE9|nr:VOC family protein [Streptomyces sp. NP-1717]